jgi:hypothetical protein
MKKLVTISSTLLGVVFLAGCGQQPVSQTQPVVPAPVAQQPAQPVTNKQANSNQKTFQDASLNYTINYPSDWSFKKDGNADMITVSFSPSSSTPFSVDIDSIPTSVAITEKEVIDFVAAAKQEYSNPGEKVYDAKEFIYTADDGSISKGQQLKADYTENGTKYRVWYIAVAKDKTLQAWRYVSSVDEYDKNYDIALGMLNSWKILK